MKTLNLTRRTYFWADTRAGVWSFRVHAYGLSLRSAWNTPMRAEFFGHRRPILRAFGWRLFLLKRET